MMWGFGSGAGWAMWPVMVAAMIAFWTVIILAIRALWRGGRSDDDPTGAARPDPLTLLNEGLARGDISPDEYESRRRILVDGH